MSSNRVIGAFEEAVEQGSQALRHGAKKQASDFAKTTVNQVTGSSQDQGTNEQAQNNQNQLTDDQAKQFLKDLYGKSKPEEKKSPQSNQTAVQKALGIKAKDSNEGKTPEEVANMDVIRKELHSEYYQKLVNPPKQREESVQEKLEREDEEEKVELWQKEKKKPKDLPVTVKQGTGEKMVGVAG
jgi:hypothetical protein